MENRYDAVTDDTELKSILDALSESWNKDLTPYLKILEDNLVTTVKDIRTASLEAWANWHLPSKLSDELKKLVIPSRLVGKLIEVVYLKPQKIRIQKNDNLEQIIRNVFTLYESSKIVLKKSDIVIGTSFENVEDNQTYTLQVTLPSTIPGPPKAKKRKLDNFQQFVSTQKPSDWSIPQLLLKQPHDPAKDVLYELGAHFLFVNRKESRKTLVSAVTNQYLLWKNKKNLTKDSFRRSLKHIIVGGAPGIGKSTFAVKSLVKENRCLIKKEGNYIPSDSPLVELLSNCISNGLIISTSFVDTILDAERREATLFLLGRIAHQFLCPQEIYSEFLKKFPSSRSLNELMDVLISTCKLKTPTMMVLHVDETNMSPPDFLEALDRAATDILFHSHIFLVLIQTGVKSTPMEAAAKAASSAVGGAFVPLKLLKKQDLEKVAKYFVNGELNEFLEQLIIYCGGNPRYLEYALISFASNGHPTEAKFSLKQISLLDINSTNEQTLNSEEKSQILSVIADEIKARTNLIKFFNLTHETICSLIAFELLNKKVKRNTLVGQYIIEDLESEGLIFLSPKDEEFLISIPYFTYQLLFKLSEAKVTPPKLFRSTSNLLESRSNELQDLLFILMKLELFRETMKTNIFRLSDIFPTHKHLKDKAFEIPEHLRFAEVRENVSQWTVQRFTRHIVGLKQDGCCSAIGPPSTSFPDAWIIVKSLEEKCDYVLYVQSKRRRDSGKKSTPGSSARESLEEEHEKCQFYEKHYFIFITDDKERSDTSYDENEIVITSSLAEKFYGKCASLRKLHLI